MIYEVDLGTWERGRMVDIDADSPREAARRVLATYLLGGAVVEIRENGTRRIVFDYWNGFSLYEKSLDK